MRRRHQILADTDQFFLNIAVLAGEGCRGRRKAGNRRQLYTTGHVRQKRRGIRHPHKRHGDEWFTAPVNTPQGLYFTGYDGEDACPDMGDSAIRETFGVGGMAMIAAPAVTRFVGAGAGTRMRFVPARNDGDYH